MTAIQKPSLAIRKTSSTQATAKSALHKFKHSVHILIRCLKNRDPNLMHNLYQPIAYAKDPKASSGIISKGLISYTLTEVSQENLHKANAIDLLAKLPLGKALKIPKGFEIVSFCGGGSGSINLIIQNPSTQQKFFMKYFPCNNTDPQPIRSGQAQTVPLGHHPYCQFDESVAQLKQQEAYLEFSESIPAQNIDLKCASDLVRQFRKACCQLGVVVSFDTPKDPFFSLELEVLGTEGNISEQSSRQSSYSEELDALASRSRTASAASETYVDLLENPIERLRHSMKSPVVEATFSLSEVAEGAQDLSVAINEADSTKALDTLIEISKSYIQDMLHYQQDIAYEDLRAKDRQEPDKIAFINKMKDRFAALEGDFAPLKQLPLTNFWPSKDKAVKCLGDLLALESFRYQGKYYPNPFHFLPQLFEKFPKLFHVKRKITDVHGDGQASNLMLGKAGRIIQVDVRPGNKLVSPHLEWAKMLVFGPEFTAGILSNKAVVACDETGLFLAFDDSVRIKNHLYYKDQILKLISDKSWVEMKNFKDAVSPDLGLNIRLLGAIQAEADSGAILAKLNSKPEDAVLKRRIAADKVLALKLQKDFIDYALDEQNFPQESSLREERKRLQGYILESLASKNSRSKQS